VLTLPERATHNHGDVGVRDVEALVEHPRRHERPEVSVAEALQNVITLWAADVARERHDEVLAGDGIRRFVVGGEDQPRECRWRTSRDSSTQDRSMSHGHA